MDIKIFTLEILNHINMIYEANSPDLSDISLMNGITSLAIANLSVGVTTNDSHYIQFSKKIMEIVLEKINADEYDLKNTSSYCNGFAGICEALNSFSQNKILDLDVNVELEPLDDFLFESAKLLFKNINPDYLHGAMGILYYFVNRYEGNKNKFQIFIDVLIEHYSDNAIIDEKGIRISNIVLSDQKQTEFNFSLSHGLCGHLLIFLELYKKYKSPKLLKLIEGIEKYISLHKKNPNSQNNIYNTFFPTFVVEDEFRLEDDQDLGYNSRLAWCYGELNYVLVYFKLNEVFGEKRYWEIANKILKNTVSRNNPIDAKLNSPFFCHGSSGLIALYMHFYKKTKDHIYKEIADYWMNYTLNICFKEDLYASIESNPFCLLEGGAGLVVGLNSFFNDDFHCENRMIIWERFLLLN